MFFERGSFMALLGVITEGVDETQSLLRPETGSVIEITEKEQLQEVNGVVIGLIEKEELGTIVEWLLLCREYPRLFVWIFSSVQIKEECTILMKLGANGVFFDWSYLTFTVENAMKKIDEIQQINSLSVSEAVINFKNQSVLVDGIEKDLTKKEFLLFQILYENKEVCVSYEELQKQIWPNKKVTELYLLTNAIFHLRKKIKNSHFFQIKTIRSKGYLLTIKPERTRGSNS